MKTYYYIVDLDERGVYKCHVENSKGEEIWGVSTEDSEDGLFWPVEDGFMKSVKDMDGLAGYLIEMGFICDGGKIIYKG